MDAGHGHRHPTPEGPSHQRRLTLTLILAAAYMVTEVAGGLWTHSLALLADAGHMASDVGALGLALFAMSMARRPPTSEHTYGFHRLEILAALVNGAALVTISVFIFLEAIGRFRSPPQIHAPWMVAVAAGGLLINGVGLWLLHGGSSENLNVKGAWLHVATDALGSLQALTAGGLIWAFGWHWADPVASMLIAALVVFSAWSLLRDSVAVLMEGAPGHIDVDEVCGALMTTPGVRGVHDLHVWTITSGFVALSAHVVAAEEQPPSLLLDRLRRRLEQGFGIEHVTLQIEGADSEACRPCPNGSRNPGPSAT